MKRILQHLESPSTRQAILAQSRPASGDAGISRLAGARVSARRRGIQGRRRFAPELSATHGCLDGARGAQLCRHAAGRRSIWFPSRTASSGRSRARRSFSPRRCRRAADTRRWWRRPTTGARRRSKAIRCIPRARGRRTLGRRLRFSIFTIRIVRAFSS